MRAFGHLRIERGMTLIELLVSMAIFGLVMTLVAQAVNQVGHIARVADEASQQLSGRWAQGWSVQQTLANLAAPLEGGLRPFAGGPDSLEGYSTQPLERANLGLGRVVLQLRALRDPATRTALYADYSSDSENGGNNLQRVAVFQGRVEFVFRKHSGDWVHNWPPMSTRKASESEPLPSAIMVRDLDTRRVLMVYPVYANGTAQRAVAPSPFEGATR